MAATLTFLVPAAAPAQAAPSPDELARRAAEAHEAHCSDVKVAEATRAAQALAQVSPILADVSQLYDSTREPFLLYWRGMLNQCLGQADRAAKDLLGFIEVADEQAVYAGLLSQARRGLRQLGVAPPRSKRSGPEPGGVVAAGLLFGSAGVLAGGSVGEGRRAAESQTEFDEGVRPWADSYGIGERLDREVATANGLLVGAVAAGIAGAVALSITVAVSRQDPPASVVVVPLPSGGLAVGVGGAW